MDAGTAGALIGAVVALVAVLIYVKSNKLDK